MSIELDLNDKDTVSVVIKDNSGGFPNNYIQNFPAYIANHDYKSAALAVQIMPIPSLQAKIR